MFFRRDPKDDLEDDWYRTIRNRRKIMYASNLHWYGDRHEAIEMMKEVCISEGLDKSGNENETQGVQQEEGVSIDSDPQEYSSVAEYEEVQKKGGRRRARC